MTRRGNRATRPRLYAVFYAPPPSFDNSLIIRVAYYKNPPFTHFELCWDPSSLAILDDGRPHGEPRRGETLPRFKVRGTGIVRDDNGITVSNRSYSRPGYVWVRLKCSLRQLDMIDSYALRMQETNATFDLWGMLWSLIGLPRKPPGYNGEPIMNMRRWFCSQYAVCLLQEVGLFPRDFNASNLHPTDIFLILVTTNGNNAIPRPIPYKPSVTAPMEDPPLATELYAAAVGVSVIDKHSLDGIAEVKRVRYIDAMSAEDRV